MVGRGLSVWHLGGGGGSRALSSEEAGLQVRQLQCMFKLEASTC